MSEPPARPPAAPRLTPRLAAGFAHAQALHERQTRKGTSIPYLAHLLAVAALVLEHGGDEDETIAALLHDAAEDQGGEPVLVAIRDRFGDRVADIVAACSDTFERPKPPWRARKEAHLAHIAAAPSAVRLVALADKVHNLESILRDYHLHGEALWSRFTASRDETLWYYRSVLTALRDAGSAARADSRLSPLIERLAAGVAAFEAAVAAAEG